MRHLDLFSGIGGFALACTWVWGNEYENVGHSEVEPYACKVYHRHFPDSPCLGDITKIKWEEGQADLITGGFPCQPHSVAGKRKASADERDLWGECVRAIRGVRPRYALFENVPGLLVSERGRFFNRVLTDLAESGYDVEYRILSAQSQGAPHKRERVWIVAYNPEIGWVGRSSDTSRGMEGEQSTDKIKSGNRWTGQIGRSDIFSASDTNKNPWTFPILTNDGEEENKQRRSTIGGEDRKFFEVGTGASRIIRTWSSMVGQSPLVRVDDGIPNVVERISGLGNAIVPQVAFVILQAIKDSAQTKGV